jgi:hypothetical protein
MQSQTRQDLVVSLVVLAFFIGMLVWSEQIPDPRGRHFPVLVSATAVVLCIVDMIAHTDTGIGRAIATVLSGTLEHPIHAHPLRREVVAIAWIVGATALVLLAGFLVGIPVYVLGYMLHAGRTFRNAAITALATTAFIWIGFEVLLNYDLYRGLLAEWL